MGMAASQARLLTITARMHDVEYKAQSIQNAKVQLATQSDQVYEDYLEALNDTSITLKNAEGKPILVNFTNIRGANAIKSANGTKYALRDESGKLIVEDDELEAYKKFEHEDPYKFAMLLMLGSENNNMYGEREEKEAFLKYQNNETQFDPKIEELDNDIKKVLNNREPDELTGDELKKYNELNKKYRNLLYKHHAEDIYKYIQGDDEQNTKFDNEKFKYYVSLFKQIKAAGGCISINDPKFLEIPSEESVRNSSEWLEKMINSGSISIEIIKEDEFGNVTLKTTSTSSDTNIENTNTSSVDNTALAKAEAKYEHDTKAINHKDKEFDLELSKLDTERSALDKEYESVKKVIGDNIKRTFGIFS